LACCLADHVIVEHLADFLRGRHAVGGFQPGRLGLLADDVHAQLDAFIADEHGRTGDQLAHLVLALAAERAVERVLAVAAGCSPSSPFRHSLSNRALRGAGTLPHA
jgi:hypothetical protein